MIMRRSSTNFLVEFVDWSLKKLRKAMGPVKLSKPSRNPMEIRKLYSVMEGRDFGLRMPIMRVNLGYSAWFINSISQRESLVELARSISNYVIESPHGEHSTRPTSTSTSTISTSTTSTTTESTTSLSTNTTSPHCPATWNIPAHILPSPKHETQDTHSTTPTLQPTPSVPHSIPRTISNSSPPHPQPNKHKNPPRPLFPSNQHLRQTRRPKLPTRLRREQIPQTRIPRPRHLLPNTNIPLP